MRRQNLRAYGSRVGRAGNRARQKSFYSHINQQVEPTTGEISRSQIHNCGTSPEDQYAKRISNHVVGRLFPTRSPFCLAPLNLTDQEERQISFPATWENVSLTLGIGLKEVRLTQGQIENLAQQLPRAFVAARIHPQWMNWVGIKRDLHRPAKFKSALLVAQAISRMMLMNNRRATNFAQVVPTQPVVEQEPSRGASSKEIDDQAHPKHFSGKRYAEQEILYDDQVWPNTDQQ